MSGEQNRSGFNLLPRRRYHCPPRRGVARSLLPPLYRVNTRRPSLPSPFNISTPSSHGTDMHVKPERGSWCQQTKDPSKPPPTFRSRTRWSQKTDKTKNTPPLPTHIVQPPRVKQPCRHMQPAAYYAGHLTHDVAPAPHMHDKPTSDFVICYTLGQTYNRAG